MNLEQMKKIVDGAPEWAKYYCDGFYIDRKTHSKCVSIADLRTELAKRQPMDLRAVDIPHGTIVLEK